MNRKRDIGDLITSVKGPFQRHFQGFQGKSQILKKKNKSFDS